MIPIARPLIGDEEKDAVRAVLDSGRLAQGPKVAEFERAIAAQCGSRHAVAVMNGTIALELALTSLGVGQDDEVITTPFTFVATANAILARGAKPVFADIEMETFCLDPKSVEENITKATKVIIPVSLYGQPYDAEPIMKIAKQKNIRIVEDAAQAIGATYNGISSGKLGDAGTFSFYATKNVMTGEGGMIVTDNDTIARTCRIVRNQGQDESTRYEYVSMGHNFRMTEMQAALGIVQLAKMPSIIKKRKEIALRYDRELKDISWLRIPVIANGRTHVYHQYTILLEEKVDRAAFVSHMQHSGVSVGVYYPKALFEYPHLNQFAKACPNALQASRSVVSLPTYASLKDSEQDTVIAALRSFS